MLEMNSERSNWQALFETLTREKGFRVEIEGDNIQIISNDLEQIKRIKKFLQTLTKENFDETRPYRLSSGNETIESNAPATASKAPKEPPKITDEKEARTILYKMFNKKIYATLNLSEIFDFQDGSVVKDEETKPAFLKDGKLFSVAMESCYVYQAWFNFLTNIYAAFNKITREIAQAAFEGEKELEYQKIDLVGSIKTFLQECFYLYKFIGAKDEEYIRLVVDFNRFIQFLYPPAIEEKLVEKVYIATISQDHFMAYLRQVSGGNMLEVFEKAENSLNLRPILLSNKPSLPPPVKFVFLADCSGSMSEKASDNRFSSAIEMLKAYLVIIRDRLKEKFPEATLEVIFFNQGIVRRFKYKIISAPTLKADIAAIQASGDTAVHQLIKIVLQEIFEAERVEPSNTIFMALTDGEETVLEKTKIPGVLNEIEEQLSDFERHGRSRPQCFLFGLGEKAEKSEHSKTCFKRLAEKTAGKYYASKDLDQMLVQLFSAENMEKMPNVRQILEFIIKHKGGIFPYYIPVEQSGKPQRPEVIVPVPANEPFEIIMGENSYNAIVDPSKLHESAVPALPEMPPLIEDKEEDRTTQNKDKEKETESNMADTTLVLEDTNLKEGKGKERENDKEKEKEVISPTPPENIALTLKVDIEYDEIKMGPKLGQGGFGEVYKATYQGKEVAVKCLLGSTYTENAIGELEKEARLMNGLASDHIVQVYGACLKPPRFCIVMEYMSKGNLCNLLHGPEDISWLQRIGYASDVTKGLHYLHGQGILHRDLKSMNVLLTVDGHAKLCDFGLALARTETMTTLAVETRQNLGTPYWMAPETLKLKARYTRKSDVYSSGILFFEIATRKFPYAGTDPMIVINEVQKGNRPDIPAETPGKFARLIKQCWAQDAVARPEAGDVVERLETCKKQVMKKNL